MRGPAADRPFASLEIAITTASIVARFVGMDVR